MKILWLATKPPWPAEDGGRLVAANTIEGLAAVGHEVTVVAPALDRRPGEPPAGVRLCAVPAGVRSLPTAVLRAVLGGRPVSIARHTRLPVRAEVSRLLEAERFGVVHAEQAQALPQAAPAFARDVPVVFRAQNVESDLWAASAAGRLGGWLARAEAARFARWEGEAVQRVDAAIALTEDDASKLEERADGRQRVRVIPAPFVAEFPAAGKSLSGHPALVVMGSPRWLPNRQGAERFVAEAWPRVRAVLADARLHLFGFDGLAGEGVVPHESPARSDEAFPEGAVLVVPLYVASGVRMKILEAWARGIPVVATPIAAGGLKATDGRELLIARDADGFVAALRRIHEEPGLRASLVSAGRALLRERHDPASVARALAEVYEEVLGTKKKS